MIFRTTIPSTVPDRIALEQLFNKTIPSCPDKFVIPEGFVFEPPHSHLGYRMLQVKNGGVTIAGCVDRMPEAALRTENRTEGNWMNGYKIREIVVLSVTESFRRRMIGSDLLSEVEQKCISSGVEVLFGVVDNVENKSEIEEFYRSAGFVIADKLPHFFGSKWHEPKAPIGFYFYKKLPTRKS